MSLEAALQENTQVVRELIARLTAAGVMSPTAQTMSGAELVVKIDTDAKDAAKNETVEAIDYEKQVRPLLVKVSTTKGRDALVALLAKFDVTKGDQLKPGQFGKVMAAATELLPVEV